MCDDKRGICNNLTPSTRWLDRDKSPKHNLNRIFTKRKGIDVFLVIQFSCNTLCFMKPDKWITCDGFNIQLDEMLSERKLKELNLEVLLPYTIFTRPCTNCLSHFPGIRRHFAREIPYSWKYKDNLSRFYHLLLSRIRHCQRKETTDKKARMC